MPEANAAFIAAANPQTVLALIRELEEARKKMSKWRDYSGCQQQ